MWISQKTSEIQDASSYGSHVGLVSVGGKKPAVVTDGESRTAEIACPGGVLYVPKVGDEVLLERTCDEERIVMGTVPASLPGGVSEGEIYISTGGGSAIHIRRNGDIEISGRVKLSGNIEISGATDIKGSLMINGQACKPCVCG